MDKIPIVPLWTREDERYRFLFCCDGCAERYFSIIIERPTCMQTTVEHDPRSADRNNANTYQAWMEWKDGRAAKPNLYPVEFAIWRLP